MFLLTTALSPECVECAEWCFLWRIIALAGKMRANLTHCRYSQGMQRISIHTDHEAWTGTPAELRDLFISMIPAEPNLGQLQELAAVTLGCESLDLIVTKAGERPVYE